MNSTGCISTPWSSILSKIPAGLVWYPALHGADQIGWGLERVRYCLQVIFESMEHSDAEVGISLLPAHGDLGDETDGPGREVSVDKIFSKISWRLLPSLLMMTVVCYVDRTNISLAVISMSGDIGISKAEYGTAASLFFVTYVLFQIPSNMALERVGGPIWLGVILIGWGITASLTSLVRNVTQLYWMRLLLGMFEAGTFPGAYYYLSQFYPSQWMAFPSSVVYTGALVGLCISAPLAGGLLSMDGILGIAGWQWVLFIEGMPAVVLGICMMLYLPRRPDSGSFLTDDERKAMKMEVGMAEGPASQVAVLRNVVFNIDLWILLAGGFLQGIARYSAQFWTPLWVDALVTGHAPGEEDRSTGDQSKEHTGLLAALLSTVPFTFAAAVALVIGYSSIRFQERKYHMAALSLCGGIFFLLLSEVKKLGFIPGFILLTLINGAVGGIFGPQTSLIRSYMPKETMAIGFGWYISLTNVCGFIGPFTVGWVVKYTGAYTASFYFSGSVLCLAGIIFFLIKDKNQLG